MPPILIIAPPPSGTPAGTMAEKFAGARGKISQVSARRTRDRRRDELCVLRCREDVITVSKVDGVHLDADQHEILGRASCRSGREALMSYDELETERLKLRMWRESDLDAYAEM